MDYKVDNCPIEKVIPYRKNPRINDKAIKYIEKSLIEFGWQKPLLVDKSGVLIAGHARLVAARNLGMKEVPIHVSSDLSESQVRAYRIVDNRSSEFSEWDEDLLIDELQDLFEFDEELLGFSFGDDDDEHTIEHMWDTFLLEDEYIVTVRGPLPMQAEVMERLKGMEDVTIEASYVMRDRANA